MCTTPVGPDDAIFLVLVSSLSHFNIVYAGAVFNIHFILIKEITETQIDIVYVCSVNLVDI